MMSTIPDSDADADPLTAEVVTTTSHGVLVVNADGSFTYTPHSNFHGQDSFTYRASDGTAQSNLATVTLTVSPVNDAPTATDDAYQLDEDQTLSVAGSGVLANDEDVDGDALSAVLVNGPLHGSLSLNANGAFVYTPHANFNGIDSFTYRSTDGSSQSAPATVRLTITAVNDAPLGADDSYSVNEISRSPS